MEKKKYQYFSIKPDEEGEEKVPPFTTVFITYKEV